MIALVLPLSTTRALLCCVPQEGYLQYQIFLEVKAFFECEAELRAYAYKKIEEHRYTYCEGEIRDFIDLYIKYEKENREYYTSKLQSYSVSDIPYNVD